MKKFTIRLALAFIALIMAASMAFAFDCGTTYNPGSEGKVYMDTWQDVSVGNSVGTYKETSFGCRETKTVEYERQGFDATNKILSGQMDVTAGKGSLECTTDKATYFGNLCQNFNNLSMTGNVGFTGGASSVGTGKASVDVSQQVNYSGNVNTATFQANVTGVVKTSGYAGK